MAQGLVVAMDDQRRYGWHGHLRGAGVGALVGDAVVGDAVGEWLGLRCEHVSTAKSDTCVVRVADTYEGVAPPLAMICCQRLAIVALTSARTIARIKRQQVVRRDIHTHTHTQYTQYM